MSSEGIVSNEGIASNEGSVSNEGIVSNEGRVSSGGIASIVAECEKEAENEMAYSSVKQNLDNEISNMNAQLKDATHGKAVSSESLAQAEKNLALEKKGHAEDTKAQADLKHDCSMKAENYELE